MDDLSTAREVAKATRQSLSTVYRLARNGIIPSYRAGLVGHGVRFNLTEVREALRRSTTGPLDRPAAR